MCLADRKDPDTRQIPFATPRHHLITCSANGNVHGPNNSILPNAFWFAVAACLLLYTQNLMTNTLATTCRALTMPLIQVISSNQPYHVARTLRVICPALCS